MDPLHARLTSVEQRLAVLELTHDRHKCLTLPEAAAEANLPVEVLENATQSYHARTAARLEIGLAHIILGGQKRVTRAQLARWLEASSANLVPLPPAA